MDVVQKHLVFGRQEILFLKALPTSHYQSDILIVLSTLGRTQLLKLFHKNVYWWFKSVDMGQETLWIPGEEKEDCRGILFTEA